MNLKQLRKSKKLTQIQAAELCGLSRKGYQNLEEGKTKKKNSPTLLYCLTRLEEYGVSHAPSEKELRKTAPSWASSLQCDFLYCLGGMQNGKDSEGPLLLFGNFRLEEWELSSMENSMESFFGKPVSLLAFSSATTREIEKVLGSGIRLYPTRNAN
ncbi:MAG TPA: hypothetical protein DEA63_00760 [Firmicutes bacterium]|nr:hypothetical protein [Bacillota bacterium]